MNPSLEVLNEKLLELEKVSGISEYEIESTIRRTRDSENANKPCDEWRYEAIAFSFSENQDDSGNSGTYFGPLWTGTNAAGEVVENPSWRDINEDMLAYWETRSRQTTNPLLKARYTGLLWDFVNQVTGNTPSFAFAVENVEALLRVAAENLHEYEVDTIRKLKRALHLATSLNNPNLIEKARDTILDYENRVAQDDKAGLWGFSFDALIGNKKVALPEPLEERIIQELEDRLSRLDANNADPFICEHAAERLARYYRSKKLIEDVQRIVRLLGHRFEIVAKDSTPIHAMVLHEHMHAIYTNFNLKNEAEGIARLMRSVGPQIRDEMKSVSHQMDIPQKEFDDFVENFIQENLAKSLGHVTTHFVPQKDGVIKQIKELAEAAPLSSMLTTRLVDHEGRTTSIVGSADDDLDGKTIQQMAQNMSFSVIFLDEVLKRIIAKFEVTAEQLLDYIFLSPVFKASQRNFIHVGLSAYLQNSFDVAIHLMVPQIEAAFRNMVEIAGGAILKSARGGGFHLKTLDELLRAGEVEDALGEDASFYFRVLLTDQRGWNIRNRVCHGIFPPEQISKGVADRLLHVLLILALLRLNEA